jgi:hypothetical protein
MSINLDNIPDNLYKVQDCDTAEDFIAIGIELDETGYGHHSGIFICLNSELILFHFDGSQVKIEEVKDINEWFLIKKLEIFDGEDDFILNFKAHCEIICEEANPEFGFLFDGSYYDLNGLYYTETELHDVTTCVGFCIKIIQGYLNNSMYIDLSEWNNNNNNSLEEYRLKNTEYYEYQLENLKNKYPEKIAEIVEKYFKRILPSELTSSAFYDNLPITKQNIDVINPSVLMSLQVKRLV